MYSRTDILLVAAMLFCERGYHATSIREIARHLDIRDASVYAHFKSKEEVLWEIVMRTANLFHLQARSISVNFPPREQLRLLIYRHLEVLVKEPAYVQVFNQEWGRLELHERQQIYTMRATYEAHFYHVLENGARQGVFNIANIHLTNQFILSALHWTTVEPLITEDMPLKLLVSQYESLILRVLGVKNCELKKVNEK